MHETMQRLQDTIETLVKIKQDLQCQIARYELKPLVGKCFKNEDGSLYLYAKSYDETTGFLHCNSISVQHDYFANEDSLVCESVIYLSTDGIADMTEISYYDFVEMAYKVFDQWHERMVGTRNAE